MLEKIFWNQQNQPSFTTLDNVMNQLRNDDMKAGLLYDAPTLDDVLSAVEMQPILDGIVVQNVRLKAKMLAMKRVMNQVGGELSVLDEPQISDPFMRLGSAQVAVLFPLSDGQAITVYFHNPDTTPRKITPQDSLISFKFLLNKKDITIVVAPERGQEIDVRQVAVRIMRLAEKNSAAFQRQNAKTVERKANIARLTQERDEKKALLAQKAKQIEELEALQAMTETDKALAESAVQKSLDLVNKAYHFESATEEFKLDLVESLEKKDYSPFLSAKNIDGYIGAHGGLVNWSLKDGFLWGEIRGNIQGTERTIGRVEMTYDGKALFLPGETGNEPLKNKFGQPIFATEDLNSQSIYLGLLLEHALAPKVDGRNSPEFYADNPITLTGKEFGEFDTSTEEGKKTLREKAFNYLKSLADNSESVFCKALNADVEFTTAGAKKYKQLSGNPIKSKVAIKIKELIASASIFKPSEERYDHTEQKNKLTYHYLKNAVYIDEKEYGVRIVIREDSNGHFHYDLQINNEGMELIMDSSNENGTTLLPVTKRGLYGANGQTDLENNTTSILDDTSSGYVLNLFLFDKDGNLIPDEEEAITEEPITLTGKEFGEFDTSTEEGKKTLREKAFEHLTSLAENGDKVFCPALNAEVGFTKSAAKKYKSTSGNPLKAKLAIKIKDIIAAGKEFKTKEDTYDSNEKKMTYHYLKTAVSIENEEFGARIVIREDHNGKFHYDLQIAESVENILDSTEIEKATNLPSKYGVNSLINGQTDLENNTTSILDDTSSGYVLNLFLFDKDGNLIPDEEEDVTEEPITLTGKEFGEFDTSTEEGKKALREKAKEYLQSLRGKWVNNKHLGRDIEIRNRGIKKTLANSANVKKLKLLSAIEQIVATAKSATQENNYKQGDKPNAVHYFHLKNNVLLDEENLAIDVIIEEDDKGLLHYDLYLEEDKAKITAFDSAVMFPKDNSGTYAQLNAAENNTTPILDDTSSGYVLNLFLFDKDGNLIPDEEDKPEEKSADEIEYEQKLEAKANRKWQLSAEMIEQFSALAKRYGFNSQIESAAVGDTTFYSVKEIGGKKVEIEAAFRGSQVARHQDNYYDFTVTYENTETEDTPEWFYTNDFEEALVEGNKWLSENQSKEEEPIEDKQLEDDLQFIQDVIDGKIDVLALDFGSKLEEVAMRRQESHRTLLEPAVDYYLQKVTELAKQALA